MFRAVLRAIEDGELSEERIDRSVARILRLKEHLGLFDDPMVDPEAAATVLGSEAHQAVAEAAGEASVTVLQLRPTRRLPVPGRWSILLTGWDDASVRTLADELQAAGRDIEVRWTGDRPTRHRIAAVTRAARRHDITMVVTAYLGADPRQRGLVRRLRQAGRTIIVSVRSPYDAAWSPRAPVHVATYGSAPVSMRALARIIEGEIGAARPLTRPHPLPPPPRDPLPLRQRRDLVSRWRCRVLSSAGSRRRPTPVTWWRPPSSKAPPASGATARAPGCRSTP